MPDDAVRRRRLEELERACYAGMPTADLQVEVLRRLRGVMSIDAAFFATVDPDTLLFTGAMQEEPLGDATPQFMTNEFGTPDVNKFTALAAAAAPIASLDETTHDARSQSPRYRDILEPLGLGDELRVALRTDAATWGVMCLHRADARAGFDEQDRTAVARLAPHIAEGLRLSLLLDAVSTQPDATGPGVIVLEPDLTLAAITPAAELWLAEITGGRPSRGPLPVPIYAVAARLLQSDPTVDGPPRLRLQGASGRWLTLHASHLVGPTPKIAVVIEPARPADAIPIILRARGLTGREAEVAQLVLRGYSTRQMVDRLHISQYTVQDHLKSVFEKTGVRSRRELVAELASPAHT